MPPTHAGPDRPPIGRAEPTCPLVAPFFIRFKVSRRKTSRRRDRRRQYARAGMFGMVGVARFVDLHDLEDLAAALVGGWQGFQVLVQVARNRPTNSRATPGAAKENAPESGAFCVKRRRP